MNQDIGSNIASKWLTLGKPFFLKIRCLSKIAAAVEDKKTVKEREK